MKQGSTIRNIPAQSERVCNGCEFLNTVAWMRGHKSASNNFFCNHPDFKNVKSVRPLLGSGDGKEIYFNHEGSCTTPNWCPFLQKKSSKDNEIKEHFNWECAANHLPKWMEELDTALIAVMSKPDYKLVSVMLDRYNELIEKEESPNEDGFSLYGVTEEKQELIDAIIKIHEKYKEAAIKLDAETPNP